MVRALCERFGRPSSAGPRRRPATVPSRSSVGLLMALVLLLGLSGCQFGGSDGSESASDSSSESAADDADDNASPTADGSRPKPSGLPAPPAGLERFYDQDVEWSSCEAGFECATIEVPLDYDAPGGETVELALNRRPADDLDAWQGALLVNPGGPGAPGTSYARQLEPMLGAVTEQFDLVGFDPRGTGESTPVDCLSDSELDAYLGADVSPDTTAEERALRNHVVEFGAGCRQRSGQLAAHVSTVEAARDLDVIRQVVGDPAMHYFGTSYGTELGATYAELFPERVSRMVLDAAIDPTVEGVDLGLAQLRGFETALQAYLSDCVDSGQCPLGDSVEAAERRLVELLEEIDADPLPGDDERDLTIGWAFYGVALPLYAAELWPTLTQALSAALDGDGSVLLRLADAYASRGGDGYANNSMEAFVAINCLDDPSARTLNEIRSVVPRFESVSDVFGGTFAWTSIGCPQWPFEPSQPSPDIDAAGAEPILVVGTTRDPATPYQWAEALAEQLESGRLLTREGDGHGAFGHGNACVDEAVKSYLLEGTMPEKGATC